MNNLNIYRHKTATPFDMTDASKQIGKKPGKLRDEAHGGKYMDDFYLCARYLTDPDEKSEKAFSLFCNLFGIDFTTGRIYFWMLLHRGEDLETYDAISELGTNFPVFMESLDNLWRKKMIALVSGPSDKPPGDTSYDITDDALHLTETAYCFYRLLG